MRRVYVSGSLWRLSLKLRAAKLYRRRAASIEDATDLCKKFVCRIVGDGKRRRGWRATFFSRARCEAFDNNDDNATTMENSVCSFALFDDFGHLQTQISPPAKGHLSLSSTWLPVIRATHRKHTFAGGFIDSSQSEYWFDCVLATHGVRLIRLERLRLDAMRWRIAIVGGNEIVWSSDNVWWWRRAPINKDGSKRLINCFFSMVLR